MITHHVSLDHIEGKGYDPTDLSRYSSTHKTQEAIPRCGVMWGATCYGLLRLGLDSRKSLKPLKGVEVDSPTWYISPEGGPKALV